MPIIKMVHLNITFIQRAVRFYLGVKTKKEKNALLKEGYIDIAMANESRLIMEDFKYADAETLI